MTEQAVTAAAATLDRPALRPLVDELARRYIRSSRPVRAITLNDVGNETCVAVADLLGLHVIPRPPLEIRTAKIAAGLHIDDDDLRTVIEHLRGPLGNAAAARHRAAAARQQARERLAARAREVDPALVTWAEARAVARGGDLDAEVAAVEQALAIIDLGRCRPGTLLTVAAAEICRNPHAADADRRVGTLLRNAVAILHDGGWRAGLSTVGLADDDISSVAHLLDVPQFGPAVKVATLADLRASALSLSGDPVAVVENPSVIQAARDRRVATPMVCVSGQPSAAAALAVAQLVRGGHEVWVHADFDQGGLSVVEQFLAAGRRHGPGRVVPWQMDADRYARQAASSLVPLAADWWPNPSWSPELGAAMRRHGVAVFEEQVLTDLLHDLADR